MGTFVQAHTKGVAAAMAVFALSIGFILLPKNHALADTYVVDRVDNAVINACTVAANDCSLTGAFDAANTHTGADTITVPAGTYDAGNAALESNANEPLTVTGAGSGSTTLTFAGGSAILLDGGTVTPGYSLSGFAMTFSGTPQGGIALGAAMTGNLTVSDLNIGTGPSIGIYIGAADGFTITGDVSITSTTIATHRAAPGAGANINIGVDGGGSPTTPLSITGTLTISNNTLTDTVDGSNGLGASIAGNSLSVTGTTTISTNTINLAGLGAPTGIVFMDQSDLGATLGSASVTNNTVTSSTLLGGGVMMVEAATGTVTVTGNSVTGELDVTANFSGGVAVDDLTCFSGGGCLGIATAVVNNNTVTLSTASTFSGGLGAIQALATDSTLQGNTVVLSDGSTGALDGIAGIACSSFALSATCDISGNSVTGFGSSGILAATVVTGATVESNIYNNIVFKTTSASLMGGIVVGPMGPGGPDPDSAISTAYIYNNTVYGVVTGSGSAMGGAILAMADDTLGGTDVTTTTVFNNAIQGNANGIVIFNGVGTETNNMTENYNLVFGNTADTGTNYVGLSAGAEDQASDALFTNASLNDFSLQATSPAIDNGINTLGSPTQAAAVADFIGTTRPEKVLTATTTAAYDIGAYEHVNLAPTANAGSDQIDVATGTTTYTLHCQTSSDPENATLTYLWTQIDGGAVSYSSSTAAEPTVTPVAFNGAYKFRCTSTDPGGLTSSDTIIVNSNDGTTAHMTRISGSNRYNTAVAVSQNYFGDGTANALVIASGENYPDALSAGPLAGLIGGPLLLIPHNSLPSAVQTEILRVWDGSPQAGDCSGATAANADIKVIGGTASVDDAVITTLQGLTGSPCVVRISGADRRATSVAVAQTMDTIRGSGPTRVAIANGFNFPDAVAIAAPASSSTYRMPILLVSTTLNTTTTDYLDAVNASVTAVHVAGGTSSVTDAEATTLGGYGTVTRHAGANRYETATQIATDFFNGSGEPVNISVATGLSFPDALSGGLLAGLMNMPVLFTHSSVPTATSTYLSAQSGDTFNGFVFGGTAVVPDSVQTTVNGLL